MTDRAGTMGNGANFSCFSAAQYFTEKCPGKVNPDGTVKSNKITVAPGEVVWINAINLTGDQYICVLQDVNGTCVEYCPAGVRMELNEDCTQVALGIPGCYRLLLSDQEAIGVVEVSTSIDCQTDYMAWLAQYCANEGG